MNIRCKLMIILTLFYSCGFASPLYLSDIYGNNMMIQAGQPFLIKGRSTALKIVSVRIGKEVKNVTANKDGDWSLIYPAFQPGSSFEIEIKCGDEKKIIKNVITGEVWLCSGQSNMQMTVSGSDVKVAIKNKDLNQVRYFIAKNDPSSTELEEVKGEWIICDSVTMNQCSAVGLSFAWNLYNVLKKPVGLIINAIGGTPVESWTKLNIVKAKPYNAHIFRDRAQWEKDKALYETKYNAAVKDWEAATENAKTKGLLTPPKIFPPFQIRDTWIPGSLYNSLIYPIRDFSFKGVIWYQGESNSNYPFVYRYQFADMINNWRKTFSKDYLPFYIIQLPDYKTNDDWAVMRESQASVLNLKNTSLIVTLGLGNSTNIHPKQKMEVGRRVALQTLKNEYKKDIVSTGPVFETMKIEGKKIRLTFKDNGSSIKTLDEKPIRNMEVAGVGFQFLPATVFIDGNSLVVWNDKIIHPLSVRYAWGNVPATMNLGNVESLPTPPFFAGQVQKHISMEEEEALLNFNFQKTRLPFNHIDSPDFSYRELSYKEIADHTTGVVDIERSGDSLVFNRYPEETIKVLAASSTWEVRAHSTSGVTTSFITNSNKLFLSGSILPNSPQSVPFHVFCNDKMIDVLPEKGDTAFNFYVSLDLPSGVKNKQIQIVFPAYSKGVIKRVCLQKGASLEKKIFKGKMLAYGNSISQNAGEYNGFLMLAANNLGYSLHDAGIGGHVFQAEYLTQSLVKNPNVILVEYGTNDWSGNRKADNAKPFLDKLCSMYPGVPVAVIEPLYRFNPANTDAADPFKNKLDQSLEDYRQALRTICKGFKQVTVLDHKMLLPKNPDLFTDGVHMNVEGQKILSDNLTTMLKKIVGNK